MMYDIYIYMILHDLYDINNIMKRTGSLLALARVPGLQSIAKVIKTALESDIQLNGADITIPTMASVKEDRGFFVF